MIDEQVKIKLDRLNDLWMKLEKVLLEMAPPRWISCLIENSGDESRYIGIQRNHGKWRISYAVLPYEDSEEEFSWKPVTECDIMGRINAVRGVDKLKQEINCTIPLFIPKLDKAIAKLEQEISS